MGFTQKFEVSRKSIDIALSIPTWVPVVAGVAIVAIGAAGAYLVFKPSTIPPNRRY